MTKPLPIGSIKKLKKIPSMREFYLIIHRILDEDKLVTFLWSTLNLTLKMPVKNNYFSKKLIHQFLRKKKFCRQTKDQFFNFLTPWDQMVRGLLILLKPQQKILQPWMKKLQFLFRQNICVFFCWGVVGELPKLGKTTGLNKKFKRDFVIQNQVSRQKAQTDFYKLMNNADFGYDCRHNADNCYLLPI